MKFHLLSARSDISNEKTITRKFISLYSEASKKMKINHHVLLWKKAKWEHGNENTGILSMKFLFNRACRNHYLDFHCTLLVMIPEMIPRLTFCKQSFWISRNGPKPVFRLMDFPRSQQILSHALREKCPYSELFWFVFSRIRTEYREIRNISPYSVRMPENTDQTNSEHGHLLCSNSLFQRFNLL